MKADEIYGTKNPTPHRLLLDTRFELPFGETFSESTTCLSVFYFLPFCIKFSDFGRHHTHLVPFAVA